MDVPRGVDLDVPRGGVLALLGLNGAGKTTLVRILATLLRPDAGAAHVAGPDVVSEAARVREVISLTGQSAAVDDRLTARENLVLVARLRRLPRAPGSPTTSWNGSGWPTPRDGGWRGSPAGCAAGSTWR